MRRFLPLLFACSLVACGDGEPLLPADARLPDGGRYRGDIVDGLLQGEGRIDYPNGTWYQGSFRDGQWHGHGTWQGANGDRYEGEFKHGLFDGPGRFSYASGGTYEGLFKQGSLDGTGRYTEPGLSYEGQFKTGLYQGNGKLQDADGTIYEGMFDGGQPNGQGVRRDLLGRDRRRVAQARWLAGLDRLARARRDVGAGCIRLEAAAPPAAALTAVVVDRQVAELPGVAGHARVQASTEDQAATDPRRDREVDQVVDTP